MTVTGQLGLALEEDSLGVLQATRSRLTFSPDCPFSPWVSGSRHSHKQEGAGKREREKRETNTGGQRQRHALLPHNPGYGAGMSRAASVPAWPSSPSSPWDA